LADRCHFEIGDARSFPGHYDFVTIFDALHDMSDPAGCALLPVAGRRDGARRAPLGDFKPRRSEQP
jgi:hypothetical protein